MSKQQLATKNQQLDIDGFLKTIILSGHPKQILQEISEDFEQIVINKGGKNSEQLHQQLLKKLDDNKELVGYLHGHFLLRHSAVTTSGIDYAVVATDLADRLIKEFECKTPSEITQCQLVANSYTRMMYVSKLLMNYIDPDLLSSYKTNHYSILSKELDRAYRQYNSGVAALRALRQPSLNVNVKANQAFIAQNQQLNNYGKNNNAN